MKVYLGNTVVHDLSGANTGITTEQQDTINYLLSGMPEQYFLFLCSNTLCC
jgi:hypothetical protein